jgi:hydroxymethylbilane synthase
LALAQTNWVVQALHGPNPRQEFLVYPVKTLGDRVTDVPLSSFPSTGVFVKEFDRLLLDGTIDFAVHSLKDVPPEETPGTVLASFPQREDPTDALVSNDGRQLADLLGAARLGTSSVRRQAQLRIARPDLDFRADLRGNVDTRLRKLRDGQYDAIVLATAGLLRLGREAEIAERLPVEVCLPDAGQGTLVVQCRADDPAVLELLASIDDPGVRAVSLAERAVLAVFGGGCKVPVAAFAELVADRLIIRGIVARPDGSAIVRARREGPRGDPVQLGEALWRDLDAAGARSILDGTNGQ